MGIARVLGPRLRAQQTCDLASLGMASEVDPDLAEWDYGDFEGRRSVDVRQK
jgi:broad specificity phosphatase PhoE